ncbi:MAG: Cystathionine gamma-lyase, partial [uncultured Frankineae bacterium]
GRERPDRSPHRRRRQPRLRQRGARRHLHRPVGRRRLRLRDARDPRRPGPRPDDGRGHRADLPDLHLRAVGGGQAPGLRVLPQRQPDAHRARDLPRGARRRPHRPGVRERPGRRGLPAAHRHRPGRPRGHPGRRLRRHRAAVRQGARAVGRRAHARAARRPRRRARRRPSRHDLAAVVRDPDQPAAGHRRHRGAGADRARGRRPARRRQHLREPLPAAAAGARCRHRPALDDEVPRRALRRRRRGARRAGRDPRRGARLPPERARRRPRRVRQLAGAARREDARCAHGPPLRQRRARGGAAAGEPRGVGRPLPGPAGAPRARGGGQADARARRHGELPARRRRGRRAGGLQAHARVHPGRVARRRRVAHRAPRPHDPRVGGRLGPAGAGRPGAPVGRHRDRRRPGRRPRAGPGAPV